jgi:hypothetical protein
MNTEIQHPKSNIHYWQVVAASVAGVSHVKMALPCQDAHACRLLPNGVLIAAVADGAGSAALAEVGAQRAVQVALQAVERSLAPANETAFPADETLMREALLAVRVALEVEADSRGEPVRELATTLLLAVADAEHLAVIQVGDGAVVALDEKGDVFAVTAPPDAEYANATTFITSPDALESAQCVCLRRPLMALAMFSDGLQRLALKLPEGTPHVPFFAPLFRFASDLSETEMSETSEKQEGVVRLEAFLRSPRITERADDDLTLLLATRKHAVSATVKQ